MRRKDVSIKSIQVILDMEDEIFNNSQGFFWLKSDQIHFEMPVNHKTAYTFLRKIIEKYKLNVYWCDSYFIDRELKCPDYQIEYLKERYLLSFKEKSTLKLDVNILNTLEKVDNNSKITIFLKTKYMSLDSNRRSKFKNKLHSVLNKDSEQLITKSVLNKIIQFYI